MPVDVGLDFTGHGQGEDGGDGKNDSGFHKIHDVLFGTF
jgi:hypothetical protein